MCVYLLLVDKQSKSLAMVHGITTSSHPATQLLAWLLSNRPEARKVFASLQA